MRIFAVCVFFAPAGCSGGRSAIGQPGDARPHRAGRRERHAGPRHAVRGLRAGPKCRKTSSLCSNLRPPRASTPASTCGKFWWPRPPSPVRGSPAWCWSGEGLTLQRIAAAATQKGLTSSTRNGATILTDARHGNSIAFADPTLAIGGLTADVRSRARPPRQPRRRSTPPSPRASTSSAPPRTPGRSPWSRPPSRGFPSPFSGMPVGNVAASIQQASAGVKFGADVRITADALAATSAGRAKPGQPGPAPRRLRAVQYQREPERARPAARPGRHHHRQHRASVAGDSGRSVRGARAPPRRAAHDPHLRHRRHLRQGVQRAHRPALFQGLAPARNARAWAAAASTSRSARS